MTTGQKVMVLGVDGMDPRLTKKYLDKGVLPNIKKFIDRGAAREDLVLLGAVPTITPPLWTTLATGAYPGTHGITCFWNQHPVKKDTMVYSFDSRQCQAEPMWNVAVEAGKKTLVWHWPGSSWPPTSDNPLLHVVDGTQPSNINIAVATMDWEQLFHASTEVKEIEIMKAEDDGSGAGCIVTDIGDVADIDSAPKKSANRAAALDTALNAKEMNHLLLSEHEGECAGHGKPARINQTPLKEAKNWANAPEGAKEFIVTTCDGLVRRPCLILKNEDGIYDRIAYYKSKKEEEPIVVIKNGEYVLDVMDEVLHRDEKKMAARCLYAYNIAPDGSDAKLYLSNAMDVNNDALFHPKRLLETVNENVGYVKPVSLNLSGSNNVEVKTVCHVTWEAYTDWQSKAMRHLIDTEDYEIVFSHLHNVDCLGHQHWEESFQMDEEMKDLEQSFQDLMERAYVDTDKYLGDFLPYLDEGWNIIITSDHGLVCRTEEIPALGDPFGVNVKVMKELGYTVLKTDEEGNEIREIDWSKTRAVAPRGNHIYINLKGRDPEGIVDEADQYALEQQIISDLYNYRWEGRRIVSVAVRNKEAALLGMDGPYCGDIVYWLEEGCTRVHGDSLSTFTGYADTSVSPIFIAAGDGIKEGYKTTRMIRQVDVTPTIATLAGLRMPEQCEGAPVYQILK